jgi:hypothetical protein
MEAPVFLVGAERSGTTLLGRMLDSHPLIAWPCEFDFALDWPAVGSGGGWPDLIDFWSALAERREAREHRLVIRAELDFPSLVRSLRGQLVARARKPIVGVTAHRHFERILALWPDARFLYLLRDGRDVAHAHVAAGRAGNVWAAASVWQEAERDWLRLCGQVPAGRRLELRYEALVRDPQRELARICDFLGVPDAAEMANELARATHALPSADRPESWRGELSARELAWLECEIGPALRARGYAPSPVRAAWIPAARRLALRASDQLGRARFRAKRLGARLWANHRVARRFRFATLARVTAQRMAAIGGARDS